DRRRRERRRGVHRGLCGRDVPGRRDAALSLREGAGRRPGRLRGDPVTARRVVLTGRGVVSPLGVGVDAHWDALCAGRSGVARLDRLAALGLPASRGGAVAPDLVQPHLGRLPRKQQKLYNRATLFAMLGAALAMEDAGLQPGAGDPRRFGVVLGVNPLAWDLGAMLAYLGASESPTTPGTLDMAAANGFCMRHVNPLDFSPTRRRSTRGRAAPESTARSPASPGAPARAAWRARTSRRAWRAVSPA